MRARPTRLRALLTPAESIRLRRLTAADAEAFATHVAADLEHLGEFLPWPAVTDTREGAAAWLAAYEQQEDGRVVALGAWEDGELLGGGVLFHHVPEHAVVELGIWVVREAQGRGLATGICRELLTVARRDLRAERVVWTTSAGNVRSRRLAEKLGFVHEGRLRSALALRGERHDLDVLSLVGAELR